MKQRSVTLSPRLATAAISLAALCAACVSLAWAEDPLPKYQPTSLNQEVLTSIGSDAMDPLMRAWVMAYRKLQPKVSVEVSSNGSASAPAALMDGSAKLGPMVRPLKSVERNDFLVKYGFEPTQVRTAATGIAVYVSKSNPLKSISFEELDALYSLERKQGRPDAIVSWGDLGVKGEKGKDAVVALSLIPESPFQAFFRQQVLLQGKERENILQVADTKAVFEVLAANPDAIGYGSLQDKLPSNVKVLPVSRKKQEPARIPNAQTILSGEYPLSRFLSVYIMRTPSKPLEPAVTDFLRYVLSSDGQKIARTQGMIPLSSSIVSEELVKLQ